MPGALAGVRVVDFGHYVAGPLAAVMLSDQGADVIHIDPPGGPRWKSDADAVLNRGKRRISLDLKLPADLEVARRLVNRADILIENFRPGVMDRLGLGEAAMREHNPGLIYCSMPGFAADDPRASMAAWEGIIDAATENCRDRVGEAPPDWDTSRPTYTALPLASNFAAFLTATSAVMALVARHETGRGQRIDIPLFHAMFTLIGPAGAYVTAKGLHEPTPIDPNGSGVYQCGDGRFIQFDPNNHRFLVWFAEAAGITHWGPDLLDADRLKDPKVNAVLHERLAELFLTRSAVEWEDVARSGGAVLGAIRTSKEWLATDHARQTGASVQVEDPEFGPTWVGGLPVRLVGSPIKIQGPRHLPDADRAEILAELEKAPTPSRCAARISASPTSSPVREGGGQNGHVRLPLDGLRVLDLTQVFAGPTGGRLLAEFGADVVKINGPHRRIAHHGYVNRAKRSILLDIESPRGQQVLWKLIDRADVIIQNFPPGTIERYGLGYEQVRARKPDVIYASLSCYGHGGPWQGGRGYERQGQAVTGVMDRVGTVPAILGPYNLVDVGTGVMTAFAVGLAVLHRLQTGAGQHVISSLAQTAMYHQMPYMLDYAGKTYDEPRGWEALGTSALQRFYQAQDGWFFLGAASSEVGRLGEVVGLAGAGDLDDASLASALEARFAQDARSVWVDKLRAACISAQALVRLPELMVDPWVRDHGLAITQESEEAGEVTYPGPGLLLSETPVRIGRPARQPGADAEDVLAEVGLADLIPALEQQWVLQTSNLPRSW